MKVYDNFSEAYLDVLRDVYLNPDNDITIDFPGSGKNKHYNNASFIEKLNYQFTIKSPQDFYPMTKSPTRNKIIRDYIDKELPLFDSGDNNKNGEMSNISKIWEIIKNPDGTINSNYGLMVYHTYDAGNDLYSPVYTNQWNWALNRLINDKNCLQAYLHFNRPLHQWFGNRDQPCTMFIQFFIRNNKLFLTSYMRSNDLVYGTPYNISYFIRLMHRMLNELRPFYPKIELGNYTHNATSLHIYKRNLDKVKDMLAIKTSF